MWLPNWSTFQHGTDDEDRWGLRRASEPCRGNRQTRRQTCRQTDSSLALAYGRWVLLWRALRIFDPSVAASYGTHGTARHVPHDDNTWTFTVTAPAPTHPPPPTDILYMLAGSFTPEQQRSPTFKRPPVRAKRLLWGWGSGGGDGIDSLQITPIRPIL